MPCKFSICVLMVCLLAVCSLTVKAQDVKDPKFTATLALGYFQEDFKWSIAGYNNNVYVNILSEIRWQNLSGPKVGISTQYSFWKRFNLGIDFSNSFITSGTVTDTDFGADNRQDTLYFDAFDSNKGHATAFSVSIGYKIKFLKNYSITPFAGYIVNAQSLFLLGDLGNIVGDLRSTYQTTWQGLTAGFDLKIPVGEKIIIAPRFVYNQTNYSSKANWNLIEDFKHPVSFRHTAKGFGIEPSLKGHYLLKENLSLFIGGQYTYWSTGKGIDRLYLKDGQVPITQFNGATRNGFNIFIGTSMAF